LASEVNGFGGSGRKLNFGESAMTTRTIRGLVFQGLLAIAISTHAAAQPSTKTVTLIVPYAAGGGTDIVARLISDHMSRTLGRPVIVENVGGAGSTIGNDRVARAAPDGSTVLINHIALLSAPSLYSNLRYDTSTAFEPVGLVNNAPMILSGRKTMPTGTPAELLKWVQTQGSTANFAHAGIGTNTHLCAVMFGNALGLKPTFVAYRSAGPAVSDMLAGHIDLLCDQATNAIPHIQEGKLNGIAVTAPKRLDQLKDVPTTAELGFPEINYTLWHGLYVPKGTPRETVEALNLALRKAVSDPRVLAQFSQLGTLPFPEAEMTPAAHARLFSQEMERITKLIEGLGIKSVEAK
jgi:tripartite-type tricarboxylate transporter receptor subunit TctC